MSSIRKDLEIIDLSRVGASGLSSAGKVGGGRNRNSFVQNNALVRTPRKDEFKRSVNNAHGSHSKRQQDKTSLLKHKNGGARPDAKNAAKKTANYKAYESMTPEERRAYRAERRRQREIAAFKRKIAAACTALTLIAGGGACIAANVANQNNVKEIQATAISDIYMDSGYYDEDNYSKTGYMQDDLDSEILVESDTTAGKAIQNSSADKIIDAADIDAQKIERINEILDNNPDIRKAFNDVEIALRRASIEYGGNIVNLLNEMDEKFGCGKIAPGLMVCVMEQETGGFFSDWKTGEVLVAADGDTGWYQITDIAEKDFGRIAKWLKRQGVSEEDINEVSKVGRSDMRGNAGRGAMKLAFLSDMYGDDIAKILSAYNAGEGFANNGNIRKDYVKECYEDHLVPLSEYEEIWDYILNKDYYEFKEDGVPHVYVNSADGSVRYPD